MGATTIAWTQRSINPIRARLRDAAHAGLTKGGYDSGVGHYCEIFGSDCANCYASHTQPRFGLPLFPGQNAAERSEDYGIYDGERDTVFVSADIELFFDESKLREVLRRKIPTKWFWCDMTDMFGRWVPESWIDRCFGAMASSEQHTHQVLTKRVARMSEMTRPILPNVWLGCSAGYQRATNERLPYLLPLYRAGWTTWASVEPLLEPVDLTAHLPYLRWVVAGSESGPRRRPSLWAWHMSLMRQCEDAGVAYFQKQMEINGKITEDVETFPIPLRVRQFPATVPGKDE